MRHDEGPARLCSVPNCPFCATDRLPVANHQYVRHYSCQGARMRVVAGVESNLTWTVFHDGTQMNVPTSEYKLCDPPVPDPVWTDVTHDCGVWSGRLLYRPGTDVAIPVFHVDVPEGGAVFETVVLRPDFRLQKVVHANERWAFLIERRA